MFVDVQTDDSYTPQKMSLRAGSSYSDLQEVCLDSYFSSTSSLAEKYIFGRIGQGYRPRTASRLATFQTWECRRCGGW